MMKIGIIGAVAKEAKACGGSAPVNAALTILVKALEDKNRLSGKAQGIH